MLPSGPPDACGKLPWVTVLFIVALHVPDGGGGGVGGDVVPTDALTGQSSSHHPTIVVSWMDCWSQNCHRCGAEAEFR
jgi:hypothetical protein